MNAQKTVKDMFDLAETFFYDLGLEKMTDTFNEKSIIEKQKDVNMTW